MKFKNKSIKYFSFPFFIIGITIWIFNLIFNEQKSLKFNDFEKYFHEPLIFIGGSMSSGTSLVRAILDVHPTVNCGPETVLINSEIKYLTNLFTYEPNTIRLINNAQIDNTTIKKALGISIYYLMLKNSNKKFERLCNKEPGNLIAIEYFKEVFPNSKFLYVVRDGREASYSLMKRSTAFNKTFKSFYSILSRWNERNQMAYKQCLLTGPSYCKMVRYENLVNNAEVEIRKIVEFLGIEWTDRFLNHEKYIGSEIKMSKTEWSRQGLEKKIHNSSLNNWLGNIQNYNEILVNQMEMLKVFNYI